MILKIHTGYDAFCPRGTITISYDRISHVRLSFPISSAVRLLFGKDKIEEKDYQLQTHRLYNMESDYKFQIEKLSKADMPYRKARLTHKILSSDLSSYAEGYQIYVRLKCWQILILNYNLRIFFCRTKEFKKHMYYYLATSIAGILLGILIDRKVLRSPTFQNESKNIEQPNDSINIKNQNINKTISSYRDSNIQDSSKMSANDSLKTSK